MSVRLLRPRLRQRGLIYFNKIRAGWPMPLGRALPRSPLALGASVIIKEKKAGRPVKELFFIFAGRKQIGVLLTLGVRSCSFESNLPDFNF